MKLSVLSYNTLFAGRDGVDERRSRLQIELLRELNPDVFLMQETKGFEADGSARLYALEAQLGMRGFLAVAPHTGQNTAVFIRPPLQPLAFETDAVHFHHAMASLRISVPGLETPLTVTSVHLCPNGADVRAREAAYLAVRAVPDQWSLVAGDFNSASPHDPEPAELPALAPHHRVRYLDLQTDLADRAVLRRLHAAGWVDVGHHLGGSEAATVPTSGFEGTEFATMRCDYFLATKSLAQRARTYRVIRTPATDAASDHYPIYAEFEL